MQRENSVSSCCDLDELNTLSLNGRLKYLSKKDRTREATIIHSLAENNEVDQLIRILESIPTKEYDLLLCRNAWHGTALHVAAKYNRPEAAEIIIRCLPVAKRMEYLALKDIWGNTVLHTAAWENSCRFIDCIFNFLDDDKREELVRVKNKWGETALHYVAFYSRFDALKTILNHMSRQLGSLFDIMDVKDAFGSTAIENGNHQQTENPFLTWIKNNLRTVTESNLRGDYREIAEMECSRRNNILHMLVKIDNDESFKVAKEVLQKLTDRQRLKLLERKNNENKTPLQVTRSRRFKTLLQWSASQKGHYYLQSPPAVLIMYMTHDRRNAVEEKTDIEQVFPELSITPTVLENPSSKRDMIEAIRTCQEESNLSGIIVIIMCHGKSGVVSTVEELVPIKDIIDAMNAPVLKDKPKCLVVQACQTEGEDTDVNGILGTSPPQPPRSPEAWIQEKDNVLLMSTIIGRKAHRRLLLPVLAKNLRDIDGDIHEVFVQTQADIQEICDDQVPFLMSSLTKKLCLKNIFNLMRSPSGCKIT